MYKQIRSMNDSYDGDRYKWEEYISIIDSAESGKNKQTNKET